MTGHESEQAAQPLRGIYAPVSRRVFLRTAAGGMAAVTAWSVAGSGAAGATAAGAQTQRRGPAARVVGFNNGWLFGRFVTGSDQPGFDDSALATVTLPHTVVPLSWQNWDPSTWEQVWIYRKHFDAPRHTDGLRLFLDFDGAMTDSTVTLNGEPAGGFTGGYLPFSAEITGKLRPADNVLAVKLDSTFKLDVPPDQPAGVSTNVDFWQPGGIYRDVRLRAVPQVFLAGVLATPVHVLDAPTRRVDLQVTVDAAVVPTDPVSVRVELRDRGRRRGSVVAAVTIPVTIDATGPTTVRAALERIPAITLWDTGNPKLYDVIATLRINDEPLHDYRTRIGFRDAGFRLDGFYLNGERVKLFGVNRHQFFPYAGGALPDRVQAQDARIVREQLNCNVVRCSHYPQSEAFYDAADELGLMVWEEMPGWGDAKGDTAWQAAARRDVGAMILRDQNHPCVIVWGAMPNEGGPYSKHPEYTDYTNVAKSLDPSRQTGGDRTAGDTPDFPFDVFGPHDYNFVIGPDGLRRPTLPTPVDAAGKPYLVCEAVGTLSGPAIYYRRFDAQAVQQGQAAAHATVHDISFSDNRYCGLLAWSGFDYPSGSGNQYQGVKYTGVVDLFRAPKPGAAIYQAQVDPAVTPVIAPAFYWDFGSTSPVTSLPVAMICANVDRLAVYVGGVPLTTVAPDTTQFPNVPYAPSFVDFSAVDGSTLPELRIDGYLAGTKVVSRRFDADPSHDRLQMTADDTVIDADGSDATRVLFRAVDRYGNVRPYVDGLVTLSVTGPAALVGDNPLDVGTTGGTGAVWIRSLPGSPGVVRVRASHAALGTAEARITVREIAHAPRPTPYAAVALSASPEFVTPDSTTTVTTTVTNNGLLTLDSLTLALTVPGGWTATAQTPVSFTRIRTGRTVTAAWQVTVAADAHPGQAPVEMQAVYTAGPQRGVSYQTINVLSSYATLADAYNNRGISDDSDVSAANFDGVANSYSAEALTAAALAPGATLVHDGITFTWPDVEPGEPDNVVAQGQTILLSGSGTTLGILGAASPGTQSGSGRVYYTDGTTSSFSITVHNYFDLNPPLTNDVIATLPYCNDSNIDRSPTGRRNQTVYVFYTSAPLKAGKTVEAITLPAGGSIPPTGRIRGIHIFAFAIGPLDSRGRPLT